MLTLIVPGLIWTRQALADLTYDLALPAFAMLLGRGRLSRHPPRSTAETLAEVAGLDPPLPAAALRRLALGAHPGDSEWLCLDPVRLRFTQRTIVVDDPQLLNLSHEESAALAVALAPTFAALGELEMISPQAWNLRLSADAPPFPALPEASGRAASALPLDPAYAVWRHAIGEAQVQLHAHPVTRARDAAGQPLVNSLWAWGGGRLPEFDGRADANGHQLLWSNDPVAQGLARLLQIDCTALPARLNDTGSRTLAIFDALEHPARSGDALAWRDELARFETDWLAPALDALHDGRIDALHLLAPGELASGELTVRRHDLWRFWRKPASMTELAPP